MNPPRGATGLFVTFTRADEVDAAAPEMQDGDVPATEGEGVTPQTDG
jgi:hypothetical protein